MVMCSEPLMRAPRSGCWLAYSSRIAMRPGISVSAIRISLRPQSARLRSVTACCSEWVDLAVALISRPPLDMEFASAVVSVPTGRSAAPSLAGVAPSQRSSEQDVVDYTRLSTRARREDADRPRAGHNAGAGGRGNKMHTCSGVFTIEEHVTRDRGPRESVMTYRLGVDVGGTFTDLVLVSPDGVARTCKVLSTTADYARAIVDGVRQLTTEAGIPARDIGEIIHGTTVATNAILERRGARTGLLTTEGFRDLLEIGRLRLSRLYDLDFERPAPLVPRRWRREIRERMNHRGEVVTPLDREGAAAAIERLLAEGVESIAVCFLHAYANPAHEVEVGAMIRDRAPHVALTLSSEILPEMREFERTSTAVTNAYVMPVMGRYLASLEGDLTRLEVRAPLLVMQSNGGVMTADGGRRRPVHVIESGPAAGVIATSALARAIGAPNTLSIDMGGTTAKASIIEGYEIKRTGEFEIGGSMSQGSRLNKGGGFLLRVPAIDIAEVGAGGGSIVSVDAAGAIHVGPRSAGAVPGPVCYDQGGADVTLTDANVTLGYLHPERLPSGLRLDAEKARRAVAEQVAAPLGIAATEAAHGVYLLGCAGMARAVRAVTIERGRDPREFTLVAFGGNGPLFAAEMARSLEIGTILVPPAPGVFSALGLLEAEVEHHLVRTF